jgi:RNA polymerase sigma-70 factor (ECF subfamily)
LEANNDLQLFKQVTKSDKAAFDELFRCYYTPLCRYALKITGEEESAEEAVQFVFIHFWEHRKTLSIQQSVAAYLFKAVRLKVYETFRSQQIKAKYEQDFAERQELIEEENNTVLDNYELSCLIWNAVDQLPEKCAEIFRLSRDEGLTYNEIAAHLNISVKTVENQMGIAFKKLREILYPALKAKGWSNNQIQVFILLIFAYPCIYGFSHISLSA